MIYYFDISLLVAVLTAEPATTRVQLWLGARASNELMVSDWVTAEFSGALSIKIRREELNEAERAAALASYIKLCAESLTTVVVSREHFLAAARFADRHVLGLRAADALHLAVAAEYAATLCTLDRRLSEAGPALGVATLLV